jgi:hypothetical protein
MRVIPIFNETAASLTGRLFFGTARHVKIAAA